MHIRIVDNVTTIEILSSSALAEMFPFCTRDEIEYLSGFPALPDGSRVMDSDQDSRRLHEIRTRMAYESHDPIGGCVFRSINPFINRLHTLWYPSSIARLLGESGLYFGPAMATPVFSSEDNLSSLSIFIRFRNLMTDFMLNLVATEIRAWRDGVGKKGVFGEGPIGQLSCKLRYAKRIASFEVDASRSGQWTIITLYLAMLRLWSPQYIIEEVAVGGHYCQESFAAERDRKSRYVLLGGANGGITDLD